MRDAPGSRAGPTEPPARSGSSRFPTEELDPYLDDTLETLGRTADVAREHGIAYLGATFAQPDPERTRGDFRRHLDHNSEFWMRRFPMRGYATWAGIVARYDARYLEFAWTRHIPHVLVHEQIDDPASSSTCATSRPRGSRAWPRCSLRRWPGWCRARRGSPPGSDREAGRLSIARLAEAWRRDRTTGMRKADLPWDFLRESAESRLQGRAHGHAPIARA